MNAKKLNKEQLKAVRHEGGPLLIVAGAGTGKTTVITERIKYLIEKGTNPSQILALTFTEKASREMVDRVDEAMPLGYTQMWISTFHSFCDEILRDEALEIGLDPKFKLMTTAESVQFLRKNIFDLDLDYYLPLGNPDKFLSALLSHFSRLQDEDINSSDYLRWAKTNKDKLEKKRYLELAKAYKIYSELKTVNGFMDFGDLITNTLLLFRKRPNVLKKYREQFQYILVDEFQDTNMAQYALIKLLAPPRINPNLSVVGDDSQSIYKFRGAAVSNIISFKRDYKNSKTIVLTTNYRSTQTILDAAYKLIRFNDPDTLESKLGIDKNLKATKKAKTKIKFIHENSSVDEAESVAEEVVALTKTKYSYNDIAILVRANNHADSFVQAFERRGIPHQFLGPGKLFQKSEIVDLISYLKVLYDTDDSISLYRLLISDVFSLPIIKIAKLNSTAKKQNISLFEAIQQEKSLSKIINIITEGLSNAKKNSAGTVLYQFMMDTGVLQNLIKADDESKALNISKFFEKIKVYETDHPEANLYDVVDWIELLTELGESPLAAGSDWQEEDSVNILTVHSSKGLEFPVVFLVNLVSERFPSRSRREQIPIPEDLVKEDLPSGDFHIQEERRLFYVGMTRAQDRLYFSSANFYGEGKRTKKLSPFIFESLGDDVVSAEFNFTKASQDAYAKAKPARKSQSKTHIDYLSYSQIETFKFCPLHYKLKYILKLPTSPSSALSFGSSMHAALKDLYESQKFNKKLLSDNWIVEGYRSKAHTLKMKAKGEKLLLEFAKQEFGKTKKLPIALEKKFTILLKSKKQSLRIGGAIDRIDEHPDYIEIIDYKTGTNIPTQKQVDDNLQLTFYALAASHMYDKPIKLSLYYFETQKKITTARTKEQLEEAEKLIFEIKKEIEKSDFKCSNNYFCSNCEFSQFCKTQ